MSKKNLTEQEILEEIKICRTDPCYFIENYGKIRHPIKGLIPFELFDFQKDVIRKMLDNRFVIIVKSRQMGISTLMAAYSCWLATFYNGKQILILANKGEVATNLIMKCKIFLKSIPIWMRPKIVLNNQQTIVLGNESIIKASNTTINAARSEALSLLVVDEASVIDRIEDVWTAARPTLATGGNAVILGTPFGTGNWFHRKYIEAEQGRSDEGLINFVPIKLPWNLHPDRDQAWADRELADLGAKKFAQEYNVDFSRSGNTVIDAEDIDYYENLVLIDGLKSIREPLLKEAFDHNLWIWKYPEGGKNYILCADVARGDGADFSAFHVLESESLEQVAEYKGKLPATNFGDLMFITAKKYNDAMLICENNHIGFTAIQRILDQSYPKLYWTKKDNNGLFFDPLNWNVPGPNKIPGFDMTPKTRPLVISSLEETFRTKQLILHSIRTLDEIKTFVYINTGNSIKAQALDKYNDDLCMSLAIGLYGRNTTIRNSSYDLNQALTMLNSMVVEKGEHKDIEQVSQVKNNNEKYDPYKLPNGDDLKWLF